MSLYAHARAAYRAAPIGSLDEAEAFALMGRAMDQTRLAALYGEHWARLMDAAALSIELANGARTREARKGWLDQAASELERARLIELQKCA